MKDPRGGPRVKGNTKKEEISDTRTPRATRREDGVVGPSQRSDGHTHATCVLVDRYGYNKKIAFVVLMGKSRCVIFAGPFRRRVSLRGTSSRFSVRLKRIPRVDASYLEFVYAIFRPFIRVPYNVCALGGGKCEVRRDI